jgi:hypothetical protein
LRPRAAAATPTFALRLHARRAAVKDLVKTVEYKPINGLPAFALLASVIHQWLPYWYVRTVGTRWVEYRHAPDTSPDKRSEPCGLRAVEGQVVVAASYGVVPGYICKNKSPCLIRSLI